MKHLLVTSIVFLALALPSPATGQGLDPTIDFVWLCEGREPVINTPEIGMAICVGYINGFVDAQVLLGRFVPNAAAICPPVQGVTGDQVRRVFLDWANRHPKGLHESLRVSLWVSLTEAFPCSSD